MVADSDSDSKKRSQTRTQTPKRGHILEPQILGDRARYDAAFSALLAAPGASAWTSTLADAAAAASLSQGGPGPVLWHVLRRQSSLGDEESVEVAALPPSPCEQSNLSGPPGRGRCAWPWRLRARVLGRLGAADAEMIRARAVMSLDQLYAQAMILHPLLLCKVRAWAATFNGCFPLFELATTEAGGRRFLTEAEAKASGSRAGRLVFAKLKGVTRSTEKLARSYGKEVSRLLDVCRQAIVFRTGPDLIAALKAIIGDPEVRVMRVKNRLDPAHDAAASGGYRDVGLNLRLDSDKTRQLGVDGHVCEVQLLLLQFAEIRSDEGHLKYIGFRNLRGE